MTPVKQSKFGENGNCLMACIASILEVPLDEKFEMNDNWWRQIWDYLEPLGYRPFCIYASQNQVAPKGYSIATGDGPRGLLHCVIALDGEIVHDPHPEGGGIQNVRDFMLLIPLTKTSLPLRVVAEPAEVRE